MSRKYLWPSQDCNNLNQTLYLGYLHVYLPTCAHSALALIAVVRQHIHLFWGISFKGGGYFGLDTFKL